MSATFTYRLDNFYFELEAFNAYLDGDSLIVYGYAGDGVEDGRLMATYSPDAGVDYIVTRNEDNDDSELDLDFPASAHVWLRAALAKLNAQLLADR